MYARVASFLALTLSLAALLPARLRTQVRDHSVHPAKVEQLQNLEVETSTSFHPAYLPREWGRLVSIEKIDAVTYALFLQDEDGNIFVVRLTQRGGYLYLDTSDRGGVVTVIKRTP